MRSGVAGYSAAMLAQSRHAPHNQTLRIVTQVGNPARQIDPQPGRQRDHRPLSAPSTRRNARPSTWASTRSDTSEGSTISISDTLGVGDDADPEGQAERRQSGLG